MPNAKTSLKRALLSVAAMAVICAAPLGNADTLGTSGYAKGSQTFGLTIGGTQPAGAFKGTWNAADIVFWCVQLTEFFSLGGSYTDYTASEPDNPTFTLLGQLFHEAYGSATASEANSAAFQLAIWEIVYDGDLDLHAGGFRVTSGNATTIKQAQDWLDALGSYTDTYHLILLQSATHQDFVTFGVPFSNITTRVPEPAPLALLAAALLAMIVVTRRRRGFKAGT